MVGGHLASAQECKNTKDFLQYINQFHLEPRVLDNDLSRSIFREFLLQLDPHHLYLTRADSISLSAYSEKLDDQISANSCEFATVATARLRMRVGQTHAFIDSILHSPLNYSTIESVSSGIAVTPFSADEASLRSNIVRALKLEIYKRAWRMAVTDHRELDVELFRSYEANARQKVRTKLSAESTRMLKEIDNNNYSTLALWRAICRAYDPHTEFFTGTEVEEFNSQIQKEERGFGIEINFSAAGEPFIERILPGGPAWKSNVLKAGDELISLKPLDGPVLDFAELDEAEILDVFNNPAIATVAITVRKMDESMVQVSLTKEKVENTDNIISSFVVKGAVQVGYIALPGFYTNPESKSTLGCANDVARELIKLKKEGIQGLILDLRYNGGGSLAEVVDLAGIFIDYGPLGVLEQKGQAPLTLRDQVRGSIYDGPVVLLVNRLSASASEFIAAALQDYNRALIVGTATYGKATGQQVLPLPANLSNGYLKVTTNRINRITGSSLQRTGVIPDIPLPEITELFTKAEADYTNAIVAKVSNKRTYYTQASPPPRKSLQEKSAQRTAASVDFQTMSSLIALMKTSIPLDARSYFQYLARLTGLSRALQETTTELEVRPTTIDKRLYDVDAFHQQFSEKAMQEIKRSVYIREAVLVLDQWLNNP